MHAWAEVYLPVIGWRGYDPSRGLAVSNEHVAIAAGFDSESRIPGGRMVFRWITFADGRLAEPAG